MERAAVVGSGPNGLAAAITLAMRGAAVTLVEGNDRIGGGMHTAELTLPGFRHDVCSSVYPFAVASPFLRSLRLERHGLSWVHPDVHVAHPLDDGTAAVALSSVRETAAGLGGDAAAYESLMAPLARDAGLLLRHVLGPVRVPPSFGSLLRFGLNGLRSAASFIESRFREAPARALFAGAAAHSLLSLDEPATASFGILLTLCAHVGGWPFARGGAATLANAMGSLLRANGGTIETGRWVRDDDDLMALRERHGVVMMDVAPWNLLEIAADRLPRAYASSIRRYRPGSAVVKVDYALDAPAPWRAEACRRAGTVHAGGTYEEIAASERAQRGGGVHERPFVLVAQPSLFDPSRAPEGKHVLWAYCHVPNGWTDDVSDRIDAQIERFAPGFSSRVLARHVTMPKDFEAHNPVMLGGDISTGSQELAQLLTRPALRVNPYATPIDGVYLCSAATPPGSGVHGMCGYRAALSALREPLAARLQRRLP